VQLAAVARTRSAVLLRTRLTPTHTPLEDCVRPTSALQVPGWEAIPKLLHGFYGRHGGVSRGMFGARNLSYRVGDDVDAVRENWRRVGAEVPAGIRFVTMVQVHGAHVATVAAAGVDPGEADALVTSASGVALSVLTADCVPILLVAPQQRAVAAVHAGWRGTVAGVVERAVQQLQTTFGAAAETIYAALGPAIGGCCYEVGPEVVDALEARWGAMPDAIRHHDRGKARLDLRHVNQAILLRAGLRGGYVACVGPCTRCAVTDYFSYRGAGVTGRQLSFIGWKD
jgi:YfiH family protein